MKFWATARAINRLLRPDDPEPGSGGRCHKKMGQPWLAGPSTDLWCMAFVSMCLDMAGQIEAIGDSRTTPTS